MLERAREITARQRYEKVIILGGTNDVLFGVASETTVSNLEKIGLAVQRSGAEPVLSEIPPIFHNFNRKDTKDYSDEVRILNQQIGRLAREHRWKLIDYYDPTPISASTAPDAMSSPGCTRRQPPDARRHRLRRQQQRGPAEGGQHRLGAHPGERHDRERPRG